ncbi:MAG: DNA-3-methyladenine glycosylase, partial [Phycisphaerales bacterium]|nr:DNA-3-methyladenine glycosylase [Phycisphaerales bacterium]
MARNLLGALLLRRLEDGEVVGGMIVETEAYLGVKDGAAHSYGGRRTARVESMYADGGTAYVYFTYGMHHCFNVVCGRVDEPVAVLIRALEPRLGVERMAVLRAASGRRRTPVRPTEIASGPARLAQALAIDRGVDGLDLVESPAL